MCIVEWGWSETMENSFEKQLFSILSTNLSASKINNITKAAFDLIARKQHHTVVSVLTDFIMSCPKDYKLKACYVIDAIGRSIDSQLKRDGITEKDAMMSLIENELESWMPFIIQTDDTEKIKKLLDSWKKMKIFDVDKVEMILKTWFKANNNPSSLNNISTKSPQNLNNTDLLSILSNVQKPQPQPIVQSPMPTGLDPALVAQFIKQPELLQTYTKLLEQQLLSTLQPQVINQSQNYSPLVSPVPMSLPMNLPMTPNPQRVDYQRKQQPEPYKRNPNTQNEEFNIDDANQYIYTQAEGGCDNDHILVLSRTLYVGGFNSEVSRQDLMDYFGRFGPVDSIIMTIKKQNAFIKMRTREIASHALKCTHLSHLKGRQLKVGFGCGYGILY